VYFRGHFAAGKKGKGREIKGRGKEKGGEAWAGS